MYGCLIHSLKHADPNEMFYLTWNFSKPPSKIYYLEDDIGPMDFPWREEEKADR